MVSDPLLLLLLERILLVMAGESWPRRDIFSLVDRLSMRYWIRSSVGRESLQWGGWTIAIVVFSNGKFGLKRHGPRRGGSEVLEGDDNDGRDNELIESLCVRFDSLFES